MFRYLLTYCCHKPILALLKSNPQKMSKGAVIEQKIVLFVHFEAFNETV